VWFIGFFVGFVLWPFATVALQQATGSFALAFLTIPVYLEKRVRADHPLRVIREVANTALRSLSSEFAKLYSPIGRESIPPERLMRALLLQAFYSLKGAKPADLPVEAAEQIRAGDQSEHRQDARPHRAPIDPRPGRRGHRMRRREFVLIIGSAITAPRSLVAQQKAMPVIGFPSASALTGSTRS
jgi:hypothetical protein